MRKALAFILAAALIAIAVLHLYWGLGGFWPGHDEASLVDMVIGMPAGTPIPPFWACVLVALCLFTPAVAGLILAGALPNFFPRGLRWAPAAALWASAFVFLARGAATYVSPLAESARGTAFYELDRILYAPLCLALAAGLVGVGLMKPQTSKA